MATRYEQLEAWQIADELRREIITLTSTGLVAKDFDFRNEIRDAASSVARNIAEGFGRFRPKEFARFLEYSVASLMETRDLLTEGIQRKYFAPTDIERARSLCQRSRQLSRGLMRYLKSCRKDEDKFSASGRPFSKQVSGSREKQMTRSDDSPYHRRGDTPGGSRKR